jgi:serine/threonine-protein kinase RsbW
MLIASRIVTPESENRACYQVVLPTDVSLVGHLVELVAGCCFEAVSPAPRTRFRLCTVVAEAVANAMLYGNENDPSRQVTVEIAVHADHVVIGVTDEGEGFDPEILPDPTSDVALELTTGRGIYMIRQLADHVAFNDRGNTIWMTLPRC